MFRRSREEKTCHGTNPIFKLTLKRRTTRAEGSETLSKQRVTVEARYVTRELARSL